jgi:hypothetical protein
LTIPPRQLEYWTRNIFWDRKCLLIWKQVNKQQPHFSGLCNMNVSLGVIPRCILFLMNREASYDREPLDPVEIK